MTDFRDTLSALLPSPRDDEPAGLRQDILDELVDHLSSSYHRELLRGFDPAAARARALERFGDPAAMARRLWLDAMKGKIMTQRVLVATCLVLTIVSLSLAGLLWLHSNRTALQLAEAQANMAASMAEARMANQEMLRQVQAMARADQSTRSADWIPVTFKLTQDTLEGPHAAAYTVYLGRGAGSAMKDGSIHRESDEKGLVDFGVVQPGDWEFVIFRSAENGRNWWTLGNINVLPGVKVAKTVICPRDVSEKIPVRLRVDWPVDLADNDLHVAAQFQFDGIAYQPSLRWTLGVVAGTRTDPATFRNLLCRPGGKQAEIVDGRYFFPWKVVGSKDPDSVFADLSSNSLSRTADTVDLAAGDYHLDRLIVLRPVTPPKPDVPAERFDFIAQVLHPDSDAAGQNPSELVVFNLVTEPSGIIDSTPSYSYWTPFKNILFPSSYGSLTKGRFTARMGQVNEWVIPLPDELIKVVRDKVKVAWTPKRK